MGLISGIVRDRHGGALAGATITIYLAGTATPASLFTTPALSVSKTNPLTSDADGIFIGYAADGLYKWKVSRTGYPDETVDNVPAIDPANYFALAGRAGGQTAYFDSASGAATGKLSSTSHATKGTYYLNAAATIGVDELNTRIGIGTGAPSHTLDVRRSASGSAVARINNSHASGLSGIDYYDDAFAVGMYFGLDLAANTTRLAAASGYPISILTNSVERLSISGAGVGVWNDSGADNDFRMEGDTEQNLFFLDASTDRVGFGTATPATRVHNFAAAAVETRTETTSTATSGVAMASAVSATASVAMRAYGSGATASLFGITQATYTNVAATVGNGLLVGTSHNAPLIMGTQDVRRFEIDGTGQGVWNETGADCDLRFEGDTLSSLMFLDAGSDRVEFGGQSVASVALSSGVGPFVLVNHAGNFGLTISRATGADANPASLTFWKTRASAPETKTALVSGDIVGRLLFQGAADSSTAHICAGIVVEVDGTPASSRVPSMIYFQTATTAADAATVLRLTSAGVIETPRVHNNGGTTTATPAVSSGTYTPTSSTKTNVASDTPTLHQWMRVGNVVTVSGACSVTPTAGSALTQLNLTLPVASNFTASYECCGGGGLVVGTVNVPAYISSDATNDRATLQFVSSGTGAHVVRYSFTYLAL